MAELTLAVVVPDMKLSPNVGSDRSWVWNASADVSESEPEAQTLAIRFANSESMYPSSTPPAESSLTLGVIQMPICSRKHSSRLSKRTKLCSPKLRGPGGSLTMRLLGRMLLGSSLGLFSPAPSVHDPIPRPGTSRLSPALPFCHAASICSVLHTTALTFWHYRPTDLSGLSCTCSPLLASEPFRRNLVQLGARPRPGETCEAGGK